MTFAQIIKKKLGKKYKSLSPEKKTVIREISRCQDMAKRPRSTSFFKKYEELDLI